MLNTKQPVLFLSHGAPTNALLDNDFTQRLSELGRRLKRPRAVVVVSAHWITQGVRVTASERPETIHDFYGFPQELYEIQYSAPGAPELVPELQALMDGLVADPDRGLDHGAWSVLRFLFPAAEVPVLQLSLDAGRTSAEHYQLGRCLRMLRQTEVLILASGNLTHNLGAVQFHDEHAAPMAWVKRFDDWATAALLEGNDSALVAMQAPDGLFLRNHPTSEHFIPLLYALGARDSSDVVSFPYVGFQYAALSMRCVQFG